MCKSAPNKALQRTVHFAAELNVVLDVMNLLHVTRAIALAGSAFMLFGLLHTAVAQATSMQSGEMIFRVVSPCTGSASFCGPRIIGIGEITARTPQRFLDFVKDARASGQLPPTPAVSLHSPGGNLVAGIKLGQAIRRNGFKTLLQPSYEMVPAGALREETLIPDAVCASACTLAFLGGVNRIVWPGSRIGVHQFYSEKDAADEGEVQFIAVLLSTYVESMGVDRRLIDIASLTPGKTMYWLADKELKELRVVTEAPSLSAWTITADTIGTPTLAVEQRISGERTLRIQLQRTSNALSLRVLLRFERATSNLSRLANFLESGGPSVSFELDALRIEASPVQPWIRRETADSVYFERIFTLSTSSVEPLLRTQSLQISDDLPLPYSDVSLNTRLSITGFREGVALLLRVDSR